MESRPTVPASGDHAEGSFVIDTLVSPSAQSLLNCLCQKLAANPDPPKHCQLRVGSDPVAADFDQYVDYCCEGIAYVRVIRRFPSGVNFPERDELATECQPGAWGVDLAMGVFRCVPAYEAGNSMNESAWREAFIKVQNDQHAMTEAMCCWVADQDANNPYWMGWMIRDWFPFANQGGCSGGEWQITARFQACNPCGESGGFGIQPVGVSTFGV